MIRRGLWGAVALLAAAPAQAATPERTSLRYDETWSGAPLTGPDRLKDLPLNGTGSVSVTLGLDARLRYEGYADTLWGAAPDDGYLWLRLMPLADLHAGPVRAFVQPILGYARGVAGGPGPADQTGADLLQGFVDLRLPVGRQASLTLRGGRQLVALGSERLVGLRYGPNVPQPFEGGRATVAAGTWRLELMALRAVEIGPGSFDDHASPRRRLRAAYLTVPVARGAALDLYWLGYRDLQARFGAMSGVERRDTFGLRWFGRRGRIGWNWETMVQRGGFAGQAIRAWSQATETTLDWPRVPGHPKLRLRANYASGDRDPDDGRLGTFNALFPKGRYFGELTPVGPRNIVNLNPSVTLQVAGGVTIELGGSAFWRAALADGIYDVPGRLIRPAAGSSARHIGNQAELAVGWTASPTLSLSGSLAVFGAGRFLRDTGRAEPIVMAGLEAAFRF